METKLGGAEGPVTCPLLAPPVSVALETAVLGGQALPGLLLASGQHLLGDISRFSLLSLLLGMHCVTVARAGLQEDLDKSLARIL